MSGEHDSLESGIALCFVVPVRHHENAPDWDVLCRNLSQTAASIAGQLNPSWRAIVVANEGSELPDLPRGFSIERVDFSPNLFYDKKGQDRAIFHDAIRFDKGRRVLAGVLAASDAKFLMVVDDDDLVSNRLTGFVVDQPDTTGWRIDVGYSWTPGNRLLYRHSDFSGICGTSLIVPRAAFAIPPSVAEADPVLIREVFGSHVLVKQRLSEKGLLWKAIPFPGAIYRVGYVGNHSQTPSVVRTRVLNRASLRNPLRLLANLSRCRIYGDSLRREFGLP
jgi:hypothetical protein